jgi:hypothetical protein
VVILATILFIFVRHFCFITHSPNYIVIRLKFLWDCDVLLPGKSGGKASLVNNREKCTCTPTACAGVTGDDILGVLKLFFNFIAIESSVPSHPASLSNFKRI